MKCRNCGKDLMLTIRGDKPSLLSRLSPVEVYRCVRCGASGLAMSSALTGPGARVVLILLILPAMAAAVMITNARKGELFSGVNATRQEDVKSEADRSLAANESKTAEERAAESMRRPVDRSPLPEVKLPSAGAERVQSRPTESTEGAAALSQAKDGNASQTQPTGSSVVRRALAEVRKQAEEAPKSPVAPVDSAERHQPERQPAAVEKPAPQALKRIGPIRGSLLGMGTVIDVSAGGPIGEFNSFSLSSPPRLVLDIPGRRAYDGPETISMQLPLVERVRVGKHPNKLRIVVDLTRPSAIDPLVERTADGLRIVVR